jgi:hypothetical protein
MAQVECHSGQSYAERPRAFHWEGQRLEVEQILTEWRTPTAKHWCVLTREGRKFELAYDEEKDEWEIIEKGVNEWELGNG